MGEHHFALTAGDVAWRLGATVAFVLLNGFFVAAEFALVKVKPARVELLADQGIRSAKTARHVLQHLDRYLSACQLGITVASLILGALGEPAVGTLIVYVAESAGIDVEHHHASVRVASLTIAFTAITVLHMTLGEQAPKIWALKHSEAWALRTAVPIRLFTLLLFPVIAVINRISNALLRVVGIRDVEHGDTPPTAEEMGALLAISAEAGYIGNPAREIGQNALRMPRLHARSVMVPRRDVVWLSVDDRPAAAMARARRSGHSRFPVCEGELDRVVGVVHVKDVVAAVVDARDVVMRELARRPIFVPATESLWDVLTTLRDAHSGIAIVVDEYGATHGVIFLEDILEQIVGPLQDEFDAPKTTAAHVAPNIVELAGDLSLPEVVDMLNLPPEDSRAAATIGGYVTYTLGRLPVEGDVLDIAGYKVTVLSMANRRVSKLRFEPSAKSREDGASLGPKLPKSSRPPPKLGPDDEGS